MVIEKRDFFFEFYEKKNIAPIYSEVSFRLNDQRYRNPASDKNNKNCQNKIYSNFFIPEYIIPKCDTNKYSVKKIRQFFRGYALDLTGFKNADAYIKYRYRSNAKTIRKRARRLESSFDITYRMFYGSIEQNEYRVLIDKAHNMIVKRFEERNDTSHTLTQWNRLKEIFFTLINKKSASMFVIYDGREPIAISLGHHFKGKFFSLVSAYDIDYSKFSLGNVEIYKKIDWLLENDYYLYELGMGDLNYKREWSNHIYNFEHQFIYPNNNPMAMLQANFEWIKAAMKERVYKMAYVRYKKYKASRKKEIPIANHIEIEDLEYEKNISLTKIDHNTDMYFFLRKIIYDFLYSKIEQSSDVTVFIASESPQTFLIQGKSHIQKVIVIPNVAKS